MRQAVPAARIVRLVSVVFAAIILSGPAPASAQQPESTASGAAHRVTFEARMTDGAVPVENGVEWRIFGTQLDSNGRMPLLAEAQGGSRSFEMSAGEYFVHAAYGYAGAVKRVIIGDTPGTETFTLNAGAMQLNGVTAGDVRIPSNYLRFDVFSKDVDQNGDHQLIARKIKPGEIVPFHAGIYHVVSKYGNLNAEIRADIRVEPGKVTQATLEHHAARMTFRLVRSEGGDAIADTAWSIIAESGDVITESSSAFPTFVLAEGNYTAIAKNNEKVYQRDFKTISGVEQDIELLIQ